MSEPPPTAVALPRRQAAIALVLAALASLALPWLPWLGRPVLLLSTLAHELGHAFTALALGGHVERVRLWPDGSGLAEYALAPGRLRAAASAAGGLLGPPLAALGLCVAGRSGIAARSALAGLAVLLLVLTVVWAGNVFTWLVGLLLVGLLAALASTARVWLLQATCLFAAVQLALASFTRADYLFTAVAETGQGPMPSDVAQIADALWLPYWLWGALLALCSLALLLLGLRVLFGSLAR